MILLWCFSLMFVIIEGNVSTNDAEQKALENLKEVFMRAAMDLVSKFSAILKNISISYLGSASSMYYTKEVAKAIAHASLFNKKEGVEEHIMEGISKIMLPCSSISCGGDILCTVLSIANITADVSIQGKFLTPDLREQVVTRKVNNLAWSVFWKLAWIKGPDTDVFLAQDKLSTETSSRILNFIKILCTKIYNSSYVSDFYKETGLDDSISSEISSPVCGSSYFDFKIGLIPEMSLRMSDIYRKTKPTYASIANSTIDSMVMSSIVPETIAFKLLKHGFFENNDNLEEASRDILKLIMVGITSTRMKIHASNVGRNAMKA